MLFDKHIEPCCAYCASGTRIGDEEVACLRKGIVSPAGACRHFKYDPLKRDPPVTAPLKTDAFTQEDFAL